MRVVAGVASLEVPLGENMGNHSLLSSKALDDHCTYADYPKHTEVLMIAAAALASGVAKKVRRAPRYESAIMRLSMFNGASSGEGRNPNSSARQRIARDLSNRS
jgi:hypothetical protein